MTGHGGGYKHGRLGRCKLKLTIKAGDARSPEEHNAPRAYSWYHPVPVVGFWLKDVAFTWISKKESGGGITSRVIEILSGVTSHKVQRYAAAAVKSGFVNSLLTRLSRCEPAGLLPNMSRILRPLDGLDEATGVNTGRSLKADPGSRWHGQDLTYSKGEEGEARDLFQGR
jgi:hypothetical protein